MAVTIPIVSTLVVVGAAQPASATPSTGFLKVCKSGQNGMIGGTFKFHISGPSSYSHYVSIVPKSVSGTCTKILTVKAGTYNVTETKESVPSTVSSIAVSPAANQKATTLSTRTVSVTVTGSTNQATTTAVTYVNQGQSSTFEICKNVTSGSLASLTFTFNYSIGGTTTRASVPAGGCSNPVSEPLGTLIHVRELNVPNSTYYASNITGSTVSNAQYGLGVAPSADVTTGAGDNVITFTNSPVPTAQNGYLEVCKDASDSFVTGNFTFTITDGSFSATRTVPVGQCTNAIQVPAGTATVTETARSPYYVDGITVDPADNDSSTNLSTGTAVVGIDVSNDSSNETLVDFVNDTKLARFKICKSLTANSQGVIDAGENTFTFDPTATFNGTNIPLAPVHITVPDTSDSACVIDPTQLPLGTQVSITEEGVANVSLTGVSVTPASQDNGSTGTTANLVIGPSQGGITQANFTNQAMGTLEVCKNVGYDPYHLTRAYNGTAFQFSVNGGTPITVKAGGCSPALSVPAGTATVKELPTANFQLINVSAVGPLLDNRLVSSSTDNPATVTVPFGGVGNETVATFVNRPNPASLKICKMVDDPNIADMDYTFHYTIGNWSGDVLLTPTASGPAGEVCSDVIGPVPSIDSSGNATQMTVTETDQPAFTQVSNIDYEGNGTGTADVGTSTETVVAGYGTNMVTFTDSLNLTPAGTSVN